MILSGYDWTIHSGKKGVVQFLSNFLMGKQYTVGTGEVGLASLLMKACQVLNFTTGRASHPSVVEF
jgi:hypothetical protein